ncbi:MAG: NAD(P)/FAD-dependent oxidoreductase, partial [Ilumatobacteraceae bacterium]
MTSHTDVLIVGAGPAGIAAALTAHEHGLDVSVIDKATFPRDKCCGDGLTTGALRLLDRLGLQPATVASWKTCRDVVLRSPSGRTVDLRLPDLGQFAVIASRM